MDEKNIYEELIADTEDIINVSLPIGINTDVKVFLTVAEKEAFTSRVAEAVFDDGGEYHPEYVEPIFEITLLQMTTDIPVFDDETEENVDIEKTYRLCKEIDLYHNVKNSKYSFLVDEMKYIVNEKIEFNKQVILAGERRKLEVLRQEMEDGIILIEGIAESLMETMNNTVDMDNYAEEIAKLNENIENMSEEELVGSILEYREKE